MKGFIFALGPGADIEGIVRSGLVGTNQEIPKPPSEPGRWQQRQIFLEIIAGHLTVAPSDKIFFFKDRNIYGILEVINYFNSSKIPAVLNYRRNLAFSR